MDKKRLDYLNEKKRQNYDRVEVLVAKGKRQVYKKHALTVGKSLNGLINELLENEVNKNGNNTKS